MSPPKEDRPPETRKPILHSPCSHHATPTRNDDTGSARQARRRRAASWRLPELESRRSDPWWYAPPTAGYEAAADHLLELGLMPAPNRDGLRAMWKRGGHHRRGAERIAHAWALETTA